VKHVALLAALQAMIGSGGPRTFRYGDAFAGPSDSILRAGGEWQQGVGRLDRGRRVQSLALRTWLRWYLPRPVLLGSRYPGSATIAEDVAAAHSRRLRMSLWDSCREVVDDLRSTFPKQRVFHEAVSAQAVEAEQLDFLLVDPPGVASPRNRENPDWSELLALIGLGQHMLAWLPVNAGVVKGHARVSRPAEQQLQAARNLPRTEVSRVRWAQGGRTIGCHLIYRVPPSVSRAIRRAVEEVCRIFGWHVEYPDGV
jgi:hypothetical protein